MLAMRHMFVHFFFLAVVFLAVVFLTAVALSAGFFPLFLFTEPFGRPLPGLRFCWQNALVCSCSACSNWNESVPSHRASPNLCTHKDGVRKQRLWKECESKDCANKRVRKYYAGRDRFPRARPGVTGLTTLSLEPFGRPLPGLRGFFSPEAVGAVLPADQARSLSSGSASQGSARGTTDSAATPRHTVFAD